MLLIWTILLLTAAATIIPAAGLVAWVRSPGFVSREGDVAPSAQLREC